MHRVSIFKIVFIVFKGLKAFTGVVYKDAILPNCLFNLPKSLLFCLKACAIHRHSAHIEKETEKQAQRQNRCYSAVCSIWVD
jgi:hypothetical protein